MKINDILTENNSDTLTLYHGGRGLEFNYMDIFPNAKGRWEHGPGLYLTTSYSRAYQYARGGRKIYKVVIKRGNNLRGATIPFDNVLNFVKSYIVTSKRRKFVDELTEIMLRYDLTDSVPADNFTNIIINDDLLPSSKTPALTQFLVDNGIDYSIVSSYGGANETVVVLFNRNLILSAKPVGKEKITDFDIEFPWEK